MTSRIVDEYKLDCATKAVAFERATGMKLIDITTISDDGDYMFIVGTKSMSIGLNFGDKSDKIVIKKYGELYPYSMNLTIIGGVRNNKVDTLIEVATKLNMEKAHG